jgi:signal transduction histidine kinase
MRSPAWTRRWRSCDGDSRNNRAGSQEVTALLESFSAAGGPAVEAQLDSAVWKRLPSDMRGVSYRVLVEALTNVRRHAPNGPFVRVCLAADHSLAKLTISRGRS